MTEQPPSQIGTVAQEAARLIEDMATMARSTYSRGNDSSPYAGEPAEEPVWPHTPDPAAPAQGPEAEDHGATDKPSEDACSQCGAEHDGTPGDGTASNCRLCPLCRGIGLLRSVRPETVDLLADLAMSVAATLRDVAKWSRVSDPASSAKPPAGGPPDPDRAPVQHIPVDEESEG